LVESSPGGRVSHRSGPQGRDPRVKTLRAEARVVGPNFLVASEGIRRQFDSVIIATGAWFQVPAFIGSRKQGVFILDGPRAYADLGVSAASSEEVAVVGEGFRALQVADRLSRGRSRVHLVVSEWQHEGPSPLILGLLAGAARENGVLFAEGMLSKAVGTGTLEAVMTDSEVIACSVLAVVPRRIPKVPSTGARLGRLGGLMVDRCMRTSLSGMFAVGGCAELDTKGAPSVTLEGEASFSGRIGGANCMGEEHSMSLVRFSEATAFGLRWTRVGLGFREARASGLLVGSADRRWESSACEILYERASMRVVGVEAAAPIESFPSGVVPISSGVSLRTLAYGGLGSSDISLVSETARLGLREWQES